MIKPNELRLSNYVLLNGTYVTIKSISENRCEILQKTKRSACNYDEIEGIPLTSERLLKFGFVEHPVSWSKDISYFPQSYKTICVTISQGIMLREGDGIQDRSKDDLVVLWNNDVRGTIMVHNLQNIYYALTGEELTIQE